jgi:hypothetical protein
VIYYITTIALHVSLYHLLVLTLHLTRLKKTSAAPKQVPATSTTTGPSSERLVHATADAALEMFSDSDPGEQSIDCYGEEQLRATATKYRRMAIKFNEIRNNKFVKVVHYETYKFSQGQGKPSGRVVVKTRKNT